MTLECIELAWLHLIERRRVRGTLDIRVLRAHLRREIDLLPVRHAHETRVLLRLIFRRGHRGILPIVCHYDIQSSSGLLNDGEYAESSYVSYA